MLLNTILLIITILLLAIIIGFIVNIYENSIWKKTLIKCNGESPILCCKQNGSPINFIVDTGANLSVIDKNIVDKYFYVLNNNKKEIQGVGCKLIAPTCTLHFNYKHELYHQEFGITDLHTTFDEQSKKRGIPIHGILGCDFLNNNNFTIKC